MIGELVLSFAPDSPLSSFTYLFYKYRINRSESYTYLYLYIGGKGKYYDTR
jgi:hypothetical protein